MRLDVMLRAARERPTAAPRRPRRWDLALAWVVIAGPALAVAIWIMIRQQVGDLEDRLVAEANALVSRTIPRPVHVDLATSGTFGEAVSVHLAPFDANAMSNANERDAKRAGEVVAGNAPISALPPGYAATLGRLEPHLDGLLAGTRAAHADFPPRGDLAVPGPSTIWNGYQLATTLAALRIRIALESGDARSAVRDCLDTLALGRDAALACGLVGHMVGVATVKKLAPACAAAVDDLRGAAERRDAARRLRAIRDAFPRFSRTLADEAISSQLMVGDILSERARDALHPRARAMIESGLHLTWWERFLGRDGWRDLRATYEAQVAAADLPEAKREEAFAAAIARSQRRLNWFASLAMPSYAKYGRRADAAVRRLDALVLVAASGAFRDSRGRWPASVAEAARAGEIGAAEAARLADAVVEPAPERALRIRVPLPVIGQDPRELSLALRGR